MAKQGAVLTYVQYNDYELDNPHFNDLKRYRMKVVRIQLYHKIRNLSSDFFIKIEKIFFPEMKPFTHLGIYKEKEPWLFKHFCPRSHFNDLKR